MPHDNDVRVFSAGLAVKMPPFWRKNPIGWFANVKAQFTLKKINVDDTKYAYILSALDEEVVGMILDLVEVLPEGDKYPAIKARLISQFQPTQEQRAEQLLDMPGLRYCKPTELASDILQLIGMGDLMWLIHNIFLRQLLEAVTAPLANSTANLHKLAQEADKVWLRLRTAPRVNTVRRQPDLVQELSVSAVVKARKKNEEPLLESGLCFYHWNFRKLAQKCKPG